MFPPRIQVFEFCDQAWLGGALREAFFDGLRFLFKSGGVYRRMHVPFSRWAAAAGHRRVLDMASGNGGPAETMLESARKDGVQMPVIVLSDLFPDTDAFERLKQARPEKVEWIEKPVDAVTAPAADLISICTAFHHFSPEAARQLLTNAVRNADGIFIMEVCPRTLLALLVPLLCLIPLMLSCFFAARPSVFKIALTAIVPLVPLMIICDGIVSALRAYRPDEILAMIPEPQRSTWHWEFGSQPYLGVLRAPYFFGHRKERES
jgi:hypothetical protein